MADGTYLDAGAWLEQKAKERPKRRRSRLREATNAPGSNRIGTNLHGPSAHGEAVRKAQKAAEIAARRQQAWDLYTGGEDLTFQEIGARLGVSNYTAHQDVVHVLQGLDRQLLANADLLRAREGARIQKVISAHYGKIGRRDSAQIVLKAIDRYARLYGLDVRQDSSVPAEQVIGLVRGIVGIVLDATTEDVVRLGPEAVRGRVVAGIRRQIGPMASRTVIDAQADDEGEKGAA